VEKIVEEELEEEPQKFKMTNSPGFGNKGF